MSNIIQVEPCTFEESVKDQVLKDAMVEEYESIIHNYVWEVVPTPKGKSVVTSKWLYKIKHGSKCSIEKYKARYVARDFSQKEGIHHDEIFALVSQYTTIRFILALATSQGWTPNQMDVKTIFLHHFLKEEVFVEQLQDFEVHDWKTHVCRLKKALYG